MCRNWNGSKWIRPAKRQAIYARDDCRCVYCEIEMNSSQVEFTLDHLLPVELGGTNSAKNLVTACKSCNSAKGAKSTRQFFAFLRLQGMDTDEIGKRIRRNLRRKLNYNERKCA